MSTIVIAPPDGEYLVYSDYRTELEAEFKASWARRELDADVFVFCYDANPSFPWVLLTAVPEKWQHFSWPQVRRVTLADGVVVADDKPGVLA